MTLGLDLPFQMYPGWFLSWCLLCLHAGDDQRGAGGTEGLVL